MLPDSERRNSLVISAMPMSIFVHLRTSRLSSEPISAGLDHVETFLEVGLLTLQGRHAISETPRRRGAMLPKCRDQRATGHL